MDKQRTTELPNKVNQSYVALTWFSESQVIHTDAKYLI